MIYKNISEQDVMVGSVEGTKVVPPGKTVVTAPKYAAELIAAGQLEVVKPKGK